MLQVTGIRFEQTLGADGVPLKLLRVQCEIVVPLTPPEVARELGAALLGIQLAEGKPPGGRG